MEKAEGASADVQEDGDTFLVPDHVLDYILFPESSCCRVAMAETDVTLGGQPPSCSSSRPPSF